jgi:hypothetical protein
MNMTPRPNTGNGIRGAIITTRVMARRSAASPVRVPVRTTMPSKGGIASTSRVVAMRCMQRHTRQTSGTLMSRAISFAFSGGIPPYRRPSAARELIPVAAAKAATSTMAVVSALRTWWRG